MVHPFARQNTIYTFVTPLRPKQVITPLPLGNLPAYYFSFNNINLKMK